MPAATAQAEPEAIAPVEQPAQALAEAPIPEPAPKVKAKKVVAVEEDKKSVEPAPTVTPAAPGQTKASALI